MAVSAVSTTRRENATCLLLLQLLGQSAENKHVCSSYGSSSFLLVFPLVPCQTLGSRNSVHRERQISKTACK